MIDLALAFAFLIGSEIRSEEELGVDRSASEEVLLDPRPFPTGTFSQNLTHIASMVSMRRLQHTFDAAKPDCLAHTRKLAHYTTVTTSARASARSLLVPGVRGVRASNCGPYWYCLIDVEGDALVCLVAEELDARNSTPARPCVRARAGTRTGTAAAVTTFRIGYLLHCAHSDSCDPPHATPQQHSLSLSITHSSPQ